MKPLNEFIRDLREDNDKTQAQVAEELHIKQQYYSKYENGEYELPIRHLIGLANFYNTNTDFILQRTNYKLNLDFLSKSYYENVSVDQMLSNLLSLNVEDRKSIVEYLNFLLNENNQ